MEKTKKVILNEIFCQLACQFFINVIQLERRNAIRLLFLIEEAHWYYLDVFRAKNKSIPKYSFKYFVIEVFRRFPFLNVFEEDPEALMKSFSTFKYMIPTSYVILVDSLMRSVVLIKNFGSSRWTFPGGKINKSEDSYQCAIRETYEETGVDITKYRHVPTSIDLSSRKSDHYIFFSDISSYTTLEPKTIGEIKKVKWFNINFVLNSQNAPEFFYIAPILKIAKNIIIGYQKKHKLKSNSIKDLNS